MKIFLRYFTIIITAIFCFTFVLSPAYAECPENTVPVSIIGSDDMIVEGTNGERCFQNSDNGSGVMHILNIIIDIMSVGVGILGVVGISIVGVQYLTAGGNEEKATKSKRRLLEIVIGLATYAVLAAFLNWVLVNPNSSSNIASNTSGGSSGSNSSSASSSSTKTGTSATKPANVNKITDGEGWVTKNNKVYYVKNGQKLTGRQKIDGAYYYFNTKTGARKTGFVKVEKNGKTNFYYYQESGKKIGQQVFGTKKFKGPYNGTKKKDTWYFNSKTGKLEGVKLAVVTQHQQSMCGCGPTSIAMIFTYVSGKKITECMVECGGRSCQCSAGLDHCPDNKHWYALETFTANNDGQISPYKTKFGYYLNDAKKHTEKKSVIYQLFSGKPLVFQAPPCDDNPMACDKGFTGGSGHFLVISGYRDGSFIFNDPAGRITSATWSTLMQVDFSEEWWPSSWHFLKKRKK